MVAFILLGVYLRPEGKFVDQQVETFNNIACLLESIRPGILGYKASGKAHDGTGVTRGWAFVRGGPESRGTHRIHAAKGLHDSNSSARRLRWACKSIV